MRHKLVEFICTDCHMLGPPSEVENEWLWKPTSIVVESWNEAVKEGWLRGIDEMREPIILCPEHARTYGRPMYPVYPVSLAPDNPFCYEVVERAGQ